uniref:Methyltransferase, TIGR04325 family n=1 Tax=mine drainage metagenome TaxID=410659 RepID=E6PV52_9ZZZZ
MIREHFDFFHLFFIHIMTRIKSFLKSVTPTFVLDARAQRNFFAKPGWYATHLGAFNSFGEANEYIKKYSIPAGFKLNHDEWLKERMKLSSHDYPVLFWLYNILNSKNLTTIFDFGGSVGVSYYAFSKYFTFSSNLLWTVCELPEVVDSGNRIKEHLDGEHLFFTTDQQLMQKADIFYTAGAIHYIEEKLPELLEKYNARPEYIIVNKIPLSPASEFVTIENGGGSGCYPCKIERESSFIASMKNIGYAEQDRWKCVEHKMNVILHPELSFTSFRGFVFKKVTVAKHD